MLGKGLLAGNFLTEREKALFIKTVHPCGRQPKSASVHSNPLRIRAGNPFADIIDIEV